MNKVDPGRRPRYPPKLSVEGGMEKNVGRLRVGQEKVCRVNWWEPEAGRMAG